MNVVEPIDCVCCGSTLVQTSVSFGLHDILQKWEVHGVSFSIQTRANYPTNTCLTLFSCPRCGFGSYVPIVSGNDSFYSDVTQGSYYIQDRWDFHVASRLIAGLRSSSVLDYGCGLGAFLTHLKSMLPHVKTAGIDANPLARESLAGRFTSYESLEMVQEKFDAITLFQVIEHVEHPELILGTAVSKLSPDGILIISVPDNSGPVRHFIDSHTSLPPHHLTLWTPIALQLLCKRYGLSVIHEQTEPLPDYLMAFYLPKMLSHWLASLGLRFSDSFVRRYLAGPILHLSRKLRLKSLPFHGHTYLLACRKTRSSVPM